jgi:hypothetical protein
LKTTITLVLMLALCGFAFAQEKEIETREQLWLGYFNQSRFTNRSGLWADFHLRLTDDFVQSPGLSIARAGYTYYLTDNTRLTAGYGYITAYSQGDSPNLHEHRPWQQIQWFEKKSGYTLMQYIRLEERFRQYLSAGEVADDYLFSYRVRYNIGMTIPLKGKQVLAGTPFVLINDELHVNFGKEIVYNYFDQNRLFAGMGYQFTSTLNAHIGYLYVFQQLPSGDQYVNIHGIRLFVLQNLDFRNK